jgi:ketosteroid isomerase-like protein
VTLTPLETVSRYYASLRSGHRAELMEILDPKIVLELQEGFPGGGGTYRGLRAYLEDFLFDLFGLFDFDTTADEYIESGDCVVVLGWHRGKALVTGIPVNAPFVHVWTVRSGRLVHGRLFTDTAAFWAASVAAAGAEGNPRAPAS